MRNKIFHLKVGKVECYVRAESEDALITLLNQYGVTDFIVTLAPGKSRCATSVFECIRDKLKKTQTTK